MKLANPVNPNYAAIVVTITSITPLENCDNIVGTPILGFQAIVSKNIRVGDIGIVFPAESQLSEDYAAANNLYRHSNLNKNPGEKGYLEDNRRVRAVRFRGHRSDCLFMPLSSLSFTGINPGDLNPGDTFDVLNGHAICWKYVIRRQYSTKKITKNKRRVFSRVDGKFLPEHYGTDNFMRQRNQGVIPSDAIVTVTQKLHGTSVRIGHTIVARKLRLRERVAARLGVKVQRTEFAHVYGSRKVIKDANNPDQRDFYGSDIWSLEGRKLDQIVPENFILYGELVGWTPAGEPIQKNYTYQVPRGTCELYIYRVAIVNGQGRITDLAWDQVREFCNDMGLKHVPEIWRGKMSDLVIEDYLDKRFHDTLGKGVPLAGESPCDEGACIRLDGLAPYVTKIKGPEFRRHETKMLDKQVTDMEADEEAADEPGY